MFFFEVIGALAMIDYSMYRLFPRLSRYSADNKKLRNQMIKKYQLTNLEQFACYHDVIEELVMEATRNRHYGRQLPENYYRDPEVLEYLQARYWTNWPATVSHVMMLIHRALDPNPAPL